MKPPLANAGDMLDALLAEPVESARERAAAAFDRVAAPFEKRIVLFGAGGFGRMVLAGLRRAGVEPLAFADNNPALWGMKVEGIPVSSPERTAREFGGCAVFVVSVWNAAAADRMADRAAQLTGLGCARVVPAHFLFWKYPEIFLPYYPLDLPCKLLERRAEVRRVFDLWADEASRSEYAAQIAFRLRLDFDGLAAPAPGHYFHHEFFRPSGRETFVDCGAFDGDSILAFLHASGGRFTRIVAYEPDPRNVRRLRESVARLPVEARSRIDIYPFALGATAGTVLFEATGTDRAAGGAAGAPVRCVTLDDALKEIAPTMIKFDIEGAEPDALAGAVTTIARHRPAMAVSAYHRQSHIWEIPLALAALSENYRYYLRPDGAEGWDLVCYAAPDRREGAR